MDRQHVKRNRLLVLAACATAVLGCRSVARADAVDEFRRLADNRLAVRESLGVRSARAVDALRVEVVLGMSVSKACERAESYRIVSFQDPRYAYDRFVKPASATAQSELEAKGPPGCPIASFDRTRVTLTLSDPLQAGVEYFVIAQGSQREPVTGGRTAQGFIYGGRTEARSDDLDRAVLGLRQIEPVGPGLVKLEFGPNFSPEAAARLDHFRLRVAGQPIRVTQFGRITRIDTYRPEGWPFSAIPMHEVFLELERALADDETLTVDVAPEVTTAACQASLCFHAKRSMSNSLKVNQVGYLTNSPVKVAYLGRWMGSFPEAKGGSDRGPAMVLAAPPPFQVCRETDGTPVFGGRAQLVHRSGEMNEGYYKVDHSGENVYVLDFTDLRTPGRFFVSVPGVGRSLPFEIGENVYRKAFEVQAYGVFAQRCGIELGPPCSEWRRIACHKRGLTVTTQRQGEPHDIKELPRKIVRRVVEPAPDTGLARLDHDKALSPAEIGCLATPRPGEVPITLAAYGGHHDAGDYNPRSHLDVAQTLMDAYEMAPRKFHDGQLDIPERHNGIPDILDEALWALRLWVGLQDADGGVYHGTESAGDPNFIETVELDPTGDYAYAKDEAASYWFAGAMAQASRIMRSLGIAQEAEDFLSRARRAYRWAETRDKQDPRSPRAAGDDDAKAYAAAQLLRTTGEPSFDKDFLATCVWSKKPDAELDVYQQYDQSLAAWTYVNCPENAVNPTIQKACRRAILERAEFFIQYCRTMAYAFIRHPRAPINWGTGAYENNLPVMFWAHRLTGDSRYQSWILRTCDNTLGANPLNRSYIVGLGTRTVRAPLHNSRYSHLGEVVPGQQVEGPVQSGEGYRVAEVAYPRIRPDFAVLHTFVDGHFAIGMDEGVVRSQANTMAAFGLLLQDQADDAERAGKAISKP